MSEEKKKHVTVTRGLRGWFAVIVWWNPEYGGFWEPWQTGIGSHGTPEEAAVEGRAIAESEGLEFRV